MTVRQVRRKESPDTLHTGCCGLDVHQKSVGPWERLVEARGKVITKACTFGATTEQRLVLLL